MNNKVVTIDFDIIMAPSVYLYNDWVPQDTWDMILANPYNPNMHLLRINAEHFQKLMNFLVMATKRLSANKIHFVEDHGQIVNFITKPSDIINIDYHHDLGYPDDNNHLRVDETPTCANWVYYLNEQKLLNSYTWIKDGLRWDNPIDENKIKYQTYDLDNYDLQQLFPIDELVIAMSAPWVPPYIQPLYFTLMDYCKLYYFKDFDLMEGTYLDTHPTEDLQ